MDQELQQEQLTSYQDLYQLLVMRAIIRLLVVTMVFQEIILTTGVTSVTLDMFLNITITELMDIKT